ncbi:terminase [bacterium]|nr:terminase [bacterium]NDD84706.1 terminase [bacterium]NDG32802.1 terminase [bacterium]
MQTITMDTSSPKPDVIANTLDLVPLNQAKPKNDTISDDFEYARGSMINVIEKGQEALSDMLDVAQRSQHPRGYEVVATLINSLAGANKDLLDLIKKKKDLETSRDGGPSTVNNNLYIGSTADLLKLIKKPNE